MIPVEDHKWHRLPYEDLPLPEKHYAEFARTDNDELVVRIIGPNAHVHGTADNLNTAINAAMKWFSSVGGEL